MLTYTEQTSKEISRLLNQEMELEIPAYLDKSEVNEVLEGARILWFNDNEHNLCVLASWENENNPLFSEFYFSRFFNINGKTVVSHDATGSNPINMLIKLSEVANRYFAD